MTRFAALLRGVNLGGRTLLMRDLADTCARLGYRDARTLLASGNVVFEAADDAAAIETALERALAARGLVTDVLVREATELHATVIANPFPAAVADHPSHVLVTFHRDPFPADVLARHLALHDGPERMIAIGRDLFIDFGGREQMRASRLPTTMRKLRFPTVATARNWNTVLKLEAMLAA